MAKDRPLPGVISGYLEDRGFCFYRDKFALGKCEYRFGVQHKISLTACQALWPMVVIMTYFILYKAGGGGGGDRRGATGVEADGLSASSTLPRCAFRRSLEACDLPVSLTVASEG